MMIAIVETLLLILDICYFVVIASVIATWLTAFDLLNTSHPIVQRILAFLYQITEPIYRPFRRFIPPLGGIDISPIAVLIIIYFLQRLLIASVL